MSWGVSLRGGKDVFSDGVEDAGIFAEEVDVEDLLWVGKAEVLELGVETGVFRAEIGNAERRGDLCPRATVSSMSHFLCKRYLAREIP